MDEERKALARAAGDGDAEAARKLAAMLERERASSGGPFDLDPARFAIRRVAERGRNLVLQVHYEDWAAVPGLPDGCIIMVFEKVTPSQALLWKRIDPRFRAPKDGAIDEAPPPLAWFPATIEGWPHAIKFADGKP